MKDGDEQGCEVGGDFGGGICSFALTMLGGSWSNISTKDKQLNFKKKMFFELKDYMNTRREVDYSRGAFR